MKKLFTLLLVLVLVLSTLPTLATTAPDTSPFVLDVSAMSAEAQAVWNGLFEMKDSGYWSGDANTKQEKAEAIGLPLMKGETFRITGEEPLKLMLDDEIIFSTDMKRKDNQIFLAYFVCPESARYLLYNSKKAIENNNYPVMDSRPLRYFYDEFRLWTAGLLAPVKENNELPYEGIDVYFQGEDRVLHHGVITVQFSESGYKLVMQPK